MRSRPRDERKRRWVLGLAFSATLAASSCATGTSAAEPPASAAVAQQDSAKREAKSRYDEGVAAYREGRFDAAIAAFLAAEALAPRAANAYNIACAYERLNETALAREYYQRYLAREPQALNAGEVRDKIAALDAQATPSPAPDEASDVAPAPAPSPAVATSIAPADAGTTEARRGPNPTIMITGGALTLIGVGTGIAFELAAEHEDSALRKYRDELGPGGCSGASPPAECESVKDAAERYDRDRTLSLVGFATASAAAVGTIVYWLLADGGRASQASTTARDVARLRFDSAVTRSGAVLGLRGNF